MEFNLRYRLSFSKLFLSPIVCDKSSLYLPICCSWKMFFQYLRKLPFSCLRVFPLTLDSFAWEKCTLHLIILQLLLFYMQVLLIIRFLQHEHHLGRSINQVNLGLFSYSSLLLIIYLAVDSHGRLIIISIIF